MRGIWGALGWMVGGGVVASAVALAIVGLGERNSGAPSLQPLKPSVAAAPRPAARACPPVIASPPRDMEQPVDDVFGVRRGQSIAEAQAILLCRDERYGFQFDQFWHTAMPAVAGAQRQLMYARLPGETLTAGLVGPPGEERVAALWRDETYGFAGAPEMGAVEAELIAMYGPPHAAEVERLQRSYVWAYLPDGQPAPERAATGGETFVARLRNVFTRPASPRADCARAVKLTWLSAPTPNSACGVTITASLDAQLDNPNAASRLRLAVMDQAALSRALADVRRR